MLQFDWARSNNSVVSRKAPESSPVLPDRLSVGYFRSVVIIALSQQTQLGSPDCFLVIGWGLGDETKVSFCGMDKLMSLFSSTGGGWRVTAFSESREDGETHGPEDRACPANIQ